MNYTSLHLGLAHTHGPCLQTFIKVGLSSVFVNTVVVLFLGFLMLPHHYMHWLGKIPGSCGRMTARMVLTPLRRSLLERTCWLYRQKMVATSWTVMHPILSPGLRSIT